MHAIWNRFLYVKMYTPLYLNYCVDPHSWYDLNEHIFLRFQWTNYALNGCTYLTIHPTFLESDLAWLKSLCIYLPMTEKNEKKNTEGTQNMNIYASFDMKERMGSGRENEWFHLWIAFFGRSNKCENFYLSLAKPKWQFE